MMNNTFDTVVNSVAKCSSTDEPIITLYNYNNIIWRNSRIAFAIISVIGIFGLYYSIKSINVNDDLTTLIGLLSYVSQASLIIIFSLISINGFLIASGFENHIRLEFHQEYIGIFASNYSVNKVSKNDGIFRCSAKEFIPKYQKVNLKNIALFQEYPFKKQIDNIDFLILITKNDEYYRLFFHKIKSSQYRILKNSLLKKDIKITRGEKNKNELELFTFPNGRIHPAYSLIEPQNKAVFKKELNSLSTQLNNCLLTKLNLTAYFIFPIFISTFLLNIHNIFGIVISIYYCMLFLSYLCNKSICDAVLSKSSKS